MLEVLIPIALILAGFLVLIWSADFLVDNASVLASRLGLSAFIVGVVIIGFGTSAPEMFVSAMAALDNKGNLALGNALGSNITNIGLVLGAAALMCTLTVSKAAAFRDIPVVIVTGILAVLLARDGQISHIDGIILLTVLIAYLVWSGINDKKNGQTEEMPEDDKNKSTLYYVGATIISIAALMLASKMLVSGSVSIAKMLGIGELVIGLTIVAIGTSLPELAAAIAAARKNAHDMIIGNIIGSNIFNTLGVLGIMGVIRSTEIDTAAIGRDFPIMFGFTLLMLLLAITQKKFSRFSGVLFVGGYTAYVCYLVIATLK